MADARKNSDPLSRAAVKQIAWLGVAAIAGFVVLMVVLTWALRVTGAGVDSVGAIDAETGTVTLFLEEEPPQLDSTRVTDTISFRILGHAMEGLIRYDAKNQLVPGVAERWEIRPDGATFWLRENAQWSDGKPVTAHDFVFAWQSVVDPATASQYAFILYSVKNAEAINTGKMTRDNLGVKAVSDRQLEVQFEKPVAFSTSWLRSESITRCAKTFIEAATSNSERTRRICSTTAHSR